MLEEELKNRIATKYFKKFDCDGIIKRIDFSVRMRRDVAHNVSTNRRFGLKFKWGIKCGERLAVHVLFRSNRILNLPINVQILVVEHDTPLGGLVIEIRAFVGEDSVVLQCGEPMREAGGDVELAKIVGSEQSGNVLTVCRAALADVHGKVEACAAQHPHELGLRVRRFLKMQTTHHPLLRTRLVILHEIVQNTQLFEPLFVITLKKIPAVILENRRLDD